MSSALTTVDTPSPYYPDAPTVTQPEVVFNAQVQNLGLRFGWMRGHRCPCNARTGNPDPRCLSCLGRGYFWDAPLPFLGYFTYMRTSAAPDEPGASVNERVGLLERAEPTLTIPKNGLLNENEVWSLAGLMDIFIEIDAVTRYSDVLNYSDGHNMTLRNPTGAQILQVYAYDFASATVSVLEDSSYTYANGLFDVPEALPGAAYTVEYTAIPAYVAYRSAGGLPHTRPFAQGRDGIPKRFHIQAMDVWLRGVSGTGGLNVAVPTGF